MNYSVLITSLNVLIKEWILPKPISVEWTGWGRDNLNSGHDRDVVFAYIEEYLKEEKGIIVDIMEAILEEAEL